MTKRVDHDNVPDESIVKKINLHNDEGLLNGFILSCKDDEVYFNQKNTYLLRVARNNYYVCNL